MQWYHLPVPKMSAIDRKQFFLSRFEDQRHLLRTAINGMGSGDIIQALHVATSIRLLVHEGNNKPLLKHLNNNYLELPILDRVNEPPQDGGPGIRAVTFYCPVSAKFSAPEGALSLITDLEPSVYRTTTLGAWWENACMVLPGIGAVYRRELILGLANKEGGAHVDAEISAKYQRLLESKFFSAKINDKILGPVNLSRMVAGKAGVELLDCLDKNFPPPHLGPAAERSV